MRKPAESAGIACAGEIHWQLRYSELPQGGWGLCSSAHFSHCLACPSTFAARASCPSTSCCWWAGVGIGRGSSCLVYDMHVTALRIHRASIPVGMLRCWQPSYAWLPSCRGPRLWSKVTVPPPRPPLAQVDHGSAPSLPWPQVNHAPTTPPTSFPLATLPHCPLPPPPWPRSTTTASCSTRPRMTAVATWPSASRCKGRGMNAGTRAEG